MPYENDPNVVPTASLGQDGPLGDPPISQPTGPEAAPSGEAATHVEETPLILGKFKDTNELQRAYQELETAHGHKAKEVGDLRKQNEIYGKALDLVQKPASPEAKAAPSRDFDAELSAIEKKAEAGEISFGESLRLASQITREQTLSQARSEYQQYDADRQKSTAEQQFLDQNPDFHEVLQSGALDAILKSNPLYNNLNAYQEYKTYQKVAALSAEKEAAAKEAFEKGKSEVSKLAQGAQVANRVLSKPGSEMRNEKPTKTLDERDIKAGMLARLERERGG